jgi:hypothetical protein
LPDPARTPGAINPAVTQETIGSTICVRGWTRTIRPPGQYTSALKRQQIRDFGYADRRMSDYEEDHLVPLGLGGSPTDPHPSACFWVERPETAARRRRRSPFAYDDECVIQREGDGGGYPD